MQHSRCGLVVSSLLVVGVGRAQVAHNINLVVSYLSSSYYRYSMYAIIHTASIVLTAYNQHSPRETRPHSPKSSLAPAATQEAHPHAVQDQIEGWPRVSTNPITAETAPTMCTIVFRQSP